MGAWPPRPIWGAAFVAVGLVLTAIIVSPPDLLTSAPPVTHDEYDLISPAVAVIDGQGLSVLPFCSSEALATAFKGRGCQAPGFHAGFHVALSLWFRLFDVGIRSARVFVWLLGLVIVLECFFLGTRCGGLLMGGAAGLLLLLDGIFWFGSRQVRPETFTVAAYLAGACLLSVERPDWRRRLMAPAGFAVGMGTAGHPVGVVALPVIAVLLATRRPRLRELFAFATAMLVTSASYAGFLFVHWADVSVNLALNAAHRQIRALSLVERLRWEWDRYSLAYWNNYELSLGHHLERLALLAWALSCVLTGVELFRRREGAAARLPVLVAPAVIGIGIALLARDNGNYLYLMHLLPWLYLAGAQGIERLARLGLARNRSLAIALRALAWTLPIVLALVGFRLYARDLGPYRERRVLSYEEIEAMVTRQLGPGAFLIAAETGWLAARAAHAEFIFSKHYEQYVPAYARYPVSVKRDGSHLIDYRFDRALLDEITASGTPVFYLKDMWDWSWNVYAPFGRYAASYLALQAQLEDCFTTEFTLFTRDRGFVSLHRYVTGCRPDRREGPLFIEGRPARLGAEVGAVERFPPSEDVRLRGPHETLPIASFPLESGRPYLLQVRLRVLDGGTAVIAWNGAGLPKQVDARLPVPVDQVVYSNGAKGELSLLSYPGPALVRLEDVTLRPVELRR